MTKTEYRVIKAELALIGYFMDMMDIYDTIKAINPQYAVTWWEENLLSIAEALE